MLGYISDSIGQSTSSVKTQARDRDVDVIEETQISRRIINISVDRKGKQLV